MHTEARLFQAYFRAMGATLAEIMKATDWLATVGP